MSEQFKLFSPEATGRELRDLGMEHVEIGVDNAIPDWTTHALEWVRKVAATHPQLTSETVMDAAYAAGFPPPPEPRAWGPPMHRAAKLGWLKRVGVIDSAHSRAHCRPVTLWRSLLYR